MLEPADVTRQFLQTVISIIGRKTSEEYAAVTIRNLLATLRPQYPFVRDIVVQDTRFMELESSVDVRDSLNNINPKEIGQVLKDLLKSIMNYLGKTAGYFFIRETLEKIGVDYNDALVKTMDVDLTLLQSTFVIEKKSFSLLEIEKTDLVRRVLKTMIELVERQTSKTFALDFMAHRIHTLTPWYPSLGFISINDIRYTLGSDEVIIQPEMNSVDNQELKKAIESIFNETDKALINLGRTPIVEDLRTHLTMEYLAKLEEYGIQIVAFTIGYDAIFRHVIKTLIDVIGQTSSEVHAIDVVNQFLRKTDAFYEFLKQVKVKPAADEYQVYQISMMNNIDSISETEARRAIQQLLQEIADSLGEETGDRFIQEFKNHLEKKYLTKIEGIGVNLHMIELHHELAGEKDSQ
ncbi:MAG TPA: hypothetical protein VMT57_05240 [Candidatus Thermoplasmatota archaeon]|nr:hypothetical protein [Candidatus Thermoplasmatota archaeon]